ncbi:MSP domain protein [Oesophagostomum dentatum]|uniref:Major sperm protein n=1 Tax=Oesophagostomum dentatum TaxID=61180 RepID=A0A0B1S7X8_OESDE|nr:MSP domain protein [Oesophagostomum dentatum]
MIFEANEQQDHEMHSAEVVLNVDVAVKEQVEKFEHLQEENLNESKVSHFSEEAELEGVDVKELVHELEQSFLEEQPTVEEEPEVEVPADTHVLEKVHKLEHEFDKSLPVCEEYVHIAEHEKEQLEAAGDAASSESSEEKNVVVGPAGDTVTTCDVEMVGKVAPADIYTKTGQKIVFNAPHDDKHTYHIKFTNASDRRIAWAVKTTNMRRLSVDPACGVLHPKESTFMAASCDTFDNGCEDTKNDRIVVEWCNTHEAETSVETVSVTIEPAEVVAQIGASVSEQTTTFTTSTVIVDVIPQKKSEPKLSTSDSWEKAFVVASGSATSGVLSSQRAATSVESDVTAAREFFREVGELEKDVEVRIRLNFPKLVFRNYILLF